MSSSPYSKGMGRLFAPDPRDSSYLMRSLLAQDPTPTVARKTYRRGPILDQKTSSACVGHAWREWLSAAPIRTSTGLDAFALYAEAQKNDEWASIPHEGSSVRGGAKALDALGHIVEYRWAAQATDVVNWLLSGRGTVVVGTNWYSSQFDPSPEGVVKITPNATVVGGHAYLCIGADRNKAMLKFQQSWGTSFGKNGCFSMSFETWDRLFREQGDACSAVEKRAKW